MDELILPSQAGRILGVSSQHVRRLVDDGHLPAQRGPYGMRMIPRRAVEKMAEERAHRERDRALAVR